MTKDTQALGLTIRRWPTKVDMTIVGKGGNSLEGFVDVKPVKGYSGPRRDPKLFSPDSQFQGRISDHDEGYAILRRLMAEAGYSPKAIRSICASMKKAIDEAVRQQARIAAKLRHPAYGFRNPLAPTH